ncbi:hypothetical protein KY290_002214 [Solanum tuberosum]|uniref:Ubiquitin thioesterase OTU n=1 Tax=Solanum tuberosum TaxID=4113 RepID=A0ABQ7WPE5_SOLTU|nr:hypothetical protein KY290_002214 [Solanum tuberosum]
MRLFLPTQSKFHKFGCNSGQRNHTSAGLFIGFLVCCSASEPVLAEASGGSMGDSCESSTTGYSHGKKGRPPPNENLQRQLADELRARVADEFIKRREETEWFIEGDFITYVAQIRNSHVWGGEPELLMASHVLQMPITVYMYDQDARGLISIAEYGQEYGKDNPIKVLYHDLVITMHCTFREERTKIKTLNCIFIINVYLGGEETMHRLLSYVIVQNVTSRVFQKRM